MEKLSGAMGRFNRSLLGPDVAEEEDGYSLFSAQSYDNGQCALSPMQRLYGFAGCLLGGLLCMILSLVVFFRPIKFAIAFSFGNILAIGSTAFLIGPIQQARMMLDPVRVYATCIYIGSVILALVCALWVNNKILTLLAIISEICALIWASASLTKPILEQLCDNGTNQQKALILQRSMHQLRYSLSYIPFARRMVSDLIISCCDTEF
ncbi:hypothetical protein AMTRI_Chr01g134110 [Amborella trichopoda]